MFIVVDTLSRLEITQMGLRSREYRLQKEIHDFFYVLISPYGV